MFIEEENLILEESENTEEQAAEKTVEGEDGAAEEGKNVKMYTEEEFNKKLNSKLDEVLPKKLARKEARIRKEYEERYAPYREAEQVLNAGMGTSSITEASESLRKFYEEKGLQIPQYQQPSYNDTDMKVLAENEARQIIDLGLEEVIEEVDRLAKKGVENMTPRERLVFSQLAEHRKVESRRNELLSIGVKSEVVDSSEFKEFARQFNSETPISKVYELYEKATGTKPAEKIGSLKNGNSKEDKDYYTPDEVDKLTEKDLEDPKIFEKVRKSMLRW